MAEYDFRNYYKQAYFQEKRKNMQLAADNAAKQQAVSELKQKYERIAGHFVFRIFRGVKKQFQKPPEKQGVKVTDIVCREDSVSVKQYEKELKFQKDPYFLWISEHESGVRSDYGKAGRQTKIVYLEDCGRDFCLAKVTEPYVLFVSKHGEMNTDSAAIVEEIFTNREEAAIVYAAEDVTVEQEGKTERKNPWFKPAFSPETLLAFFYFGNVFAVRTDVLRSLPWRKKENWKENIYDFVLRAEETFGDKAKEKIIALDRVLFHRPEEKNDKITPVLDETAVTGLWGYEESFAQLKLDALKRRGVSGNVQESNVPGVYSVCMNVKGKISIVILSKDNPTVLEQCIRSIREKTSYPDYEIIVVDNGSYESNRIKVENLSKTYDFVYVCEPMEFNFSAMCNLGAARAKGEYLLLLNDDTEVIEGGFLERLAGQASIAGVGAVGAKLWYPDSVKIQHAGITNMAIGPAHKLNAFEDDRMYYDGRNYFTFNYLAVTGACLMIKNALYKEMGGLDESLPIAYNDVEFCFRLHKAGYRNVLRNDCILLHYESLSRGLDEGNEQKTMRLLEEKKKLYQKYPFYSGEDEYYSPWLSQDSSSYVCAAGGKGKENGRPPVDYSTGKKGKLLNEVGMAACIECFQITEGKAKVRGWSVLLGADNCHYKRNLLLEGTDNKRVYCAECTAEYRKDVEQVYPQQIRIGLSGITADFPVKTIENGTYKVGILYEDMLSGKRYYRMLENFVEI